MPGGDRRELEQGAASAGVPIREIRRLVVPGDLEQALFHAVVEPRAAEDELPQPVDERLASDQGNPLPVSNEVPAHRASRLDDSTVGREFDQVGRLVAVELVRFQKPELDGGCDDALLEVLAVELESVCEELDLVIPARAIVLGHDSKDNVGSVRPRLLVVLVTAVVLAAATAWLLGLSLERVLLLAPALVLGTGLVLGVLILLGRAAAESLRSLERPRLFLALAAAGIALLAILSLIGVELPRE